MNCWGLLGVCSGDLKLSIDLVKLIENNGGLLCRAGELEYL